MTREEYLLLRQEEKKDEIMRYYFNERSPKYKLEYGEFFMAIYQYTTEYPFAQEIIDKFYPYILEYYDKKFNICFLIKDYGGEGNKILFKMY